MCQERSVRVPLKTLRHPTCLFRNESKTYGSLSNSVRVTGTRINVESHSVDDNKSIVIKLMI